MYNAMLDRLPEDYCGWLIRTDYRIGVQIQLCISDPELSDSEKTGTALSLLYGPAMETVWQPWRTVDIKIPAYRICSIRL